VAWMRKLSAGLAGIGAASLLCGCRHETPATAASQPASASQPAIASPAADEIVRLEDDFTQAERAYFRAYHEGQQAATRAATPATREVGENPAADDVPPAETEPDWSKHPAHAFRPKFRALAKKYAGQPQAVRALGWLMGAPSIVPGPEAEADAKWALAAITANYTARPEVESALAYAQYLGVRIAPAGVQALYDKVLATNPDRRAQASALYCNARMLLERNARVPLSAAEREANRRRALECLHRVERDYADFEDAKYVSRCVYEAEHLQIGMTAPEIVGADAEGKEIRLSQFRGQVVVVDFWGFW
jgi:hypothetical protein